MRTEHLLSGVQYDWNGHLGLDLRRKLCPHSINQGDSQARRLCWAAEANGNGFRLVEAPYDSFRVIRPCLGDLRACETYSSPKEVDADVEEEDQDDGFCRESLES